MLRIRLFRVLLPLLLIGVVVLLIWAMRLPTPPQVPLDATENLASRVSGGEITEYRIAEDGQLVTSLRLAADFGEECGHECFEARGVRRFELPREGMEPLEIDAESTVVTGPDGQRKMKFTGPVRIIDPDLGLVIDLPHLDVDEIAGVAHSSGALFIEGANHHTRAERLIYGLAGQATELVRLECQDDAGGLLLAARGFLHDGLNDIELVQGVRFRRADGESFRAETSRVVRHEDGRLKRVTAAGNVVAAFRISDGFVEVAGDAMEASWNDAGDVTELIVDGRALIEQGPWLLSADRLVFRASDNPVGGWSIAAQGSVRLTGPVEGGTARVRAARLSVRLDENLDVIEAEAHDDVRFEAPDIQADAAVARLSRSGALDADLRIELLSGPGQRARLAQARSRVTADRIETDAGGNSMFASGRVESTLLPQAGSGALDGLFRTDQAVHFISSELRGDQDGQRLTFRGNVRGWQGEQNLSAREIVVDQKNRTLLARDRVTTRFPREREGAMAGAEEFIQITAAELDYDETDSRAIYRENVRVVLDEGWIEGDTLTIVQNRSGSGFERLLAEGNVRLEFLGVPDDSGKRVSRTTGHGDRLDYIPGDQTLKLYGDEQRAELQRGGDQAGTSRGKVLTYRLDDGTLSVEGGSISAPPPATPKTNGDAPKEKDPETPR